MMFDELQSARMHAKTPKRQPWKQPCARGTCSLPGTSRWPRQAPRNSLQGQLHGTSRGLGNFRTRSLGQHHRLRDSSTLASLPTSSDVRRLGLAFLFSPLVPMSMSEGSRARNSPKESQPLNTDIMQPRTHGVSESAKNVTQMPLFDKPGCQVAEASQKKF